MQWFLTGSFLGGTIERPKINRTTLCFLSWFSAKPKHHRGKVLSRNPVRDNDRKKFSERSVWSRKDYDMTTREQQLQQYFHNQAITKEREKNRFWVMRDYLEQGHDLQPTEPMEFYREMFPEGELEQKAQRDENGKPIYENEDGEYKYNGIVVSVDEGFDEKGRPCKTARRYTITDDLQVLEDLQTSEDFCFLSPISYVGKSRESKNARMLYALCIEVDNLVTSDEESLYPQGLINMMIQFESGVLPRPTYLVLSGNGVHLYYFLDEPIALFTAAVSSLSKFKHDLTYHIWNKYITTTNTPDKFSLRAFFSRSVWSAVLRNVTSEPWHTRSASVFLSSI